MTACHHDGSSYALPLISGWASHPAAASSEQPISEGSVSDRSIDASARLSDTEESSASAANSAAAKQRLSGGFRLDLGGAAEVRAARFTGWQRERVQGGPCSLIDRMEEWMQECVQGGCDSLIGRWEGSGNVCREGMGA